jgi:hypothetical protein
LRAARYDMRAIRVDGNDIFEVFAVWYYFLLRQYVLKIFLRIWTATLFGSYS